MTFGEIYTRIAYKVWGNSAAPTGASGVLTGANGMISFAHKKIQRDYNFWFMREFSTISTTANTQAYTLPTDFKELISCMWRKLESDGTDSEDFSSPLSPVASTDAHGDLWTSNSSTEEYPQFFDMEDGNIVLYRKPLYSDRVLHIIYWKFLADPTAAFVDGSSTEETALTTSGAGAEAIVYLVCHELENDRSEFAISDRYYAKHLECIVNLQKEDFSKRQKNLSYIKYRDV